MINSNSKDPLSLNQASVHAVLQAQPALPSFAIPLLKPNARTNTDYTPTVNTLGKINGFVQVETKGKLLPYQRDSDVKIGQDEIFALVDPDGNALAGTKQELIPHVERWIHRIGDQLCRLNFALFCNNLEYAIDLGQDVYSRKFDELGDKEGAARWFLSSFICLPLIRELVVISALNKNDEPVSLEDFSPSFIFPNASVIIVFPDKVFANKSMRRASSSRNIKPLIQFAQRSTGLEIFIDSINSKRALNVKH